MHLTLAALMKYIPVDKKFEFQRRTSDRGVPNVRISNSSSESEWMVDVYPEQFYCVFLAGVSPRTCTDVQELIGYMSSHLRKRNKI